jgi:hypothetical protein
MITEGEEGTNGVLLVLRDINFLITVTRLPIYVSVLVKFQSHWCVTREN